MESISSCNSAKKQVVKYVESKYSGLNNSLLESYQLSDASCKSMNLKIEANVVYKDRKPISFEKAYAKKTVRKKLIESKEKPHGFVRPFSNH